MTCLEAFGGKESTRRNWETIQLEHVRVCGNLKEAHRLCTSAKEAVHARLRGNFAESQKAHSSEQMRKAREATAAALGEGAGAKDLLARTQTLGQDPTLDPAMVLREEEAQKLHSME